MDNSRFKRYEIGESSDRIAATAPIPKELMEPATPKPRPMQGQPDDAEGRFKRHEIDLRRFRKYEVDPGENYETVSMDDYLKHRSKLHRSNAVQSFIEAGANNLYDYAASINKALGLKQGAEFWNKLRKENEVEALGHGTAQLLGGMVLDPVNAVGGGVVMKGAKTARVLKSAAAGAGIGAGVTTFHEYGRPNVSGEQLREHAAIGGGVVGLINAAIAALTRGKVTHAVRSVEDLGTNHARQAMHALAENPEAFGLSRAEADGVLNEINFILKGTPDPKATKQGMEHYKDALKQYHKLKGGDARIVVPEKDGGLPVPVDDAEWKPDDNWDWEKFAQEFPQERGAIFDPEGNMIHPGDNSAPEVIPAPEELSSSRFSKYEVAPEQIEPRRVTPEPEPEPMADATPSQGRYNADVYARAHDIMPVEERVIRGEQQALPLGGANIQNPLFDVGETRQLVTPNWAKPIVNDTTRYEDVVEAMTRAKNGEPNELADRAVDAMLKDDAIKQKILPKEEGPGLFGQEPDVPDYFSMPIDEIKSDPLFSYVLERARNRKATDIRYDKKLEAPRVIKEVNNGSGWENQVTPAAYSRNYEADFVLTKNDVRKIEKGEITPEIEAKIRQDMSTMVDHPDWADEGRQLRDEAFSVFANGGSSFGQHLAGGFAGGTYNAVSGEYDPNRPLDEQVAEKFLQGLAYGALGVGAIRQLRRVNPKAFEKVRSVLMENDVKPGDDLSVKLGVFAGSKAKGFNAAKERGEVFPGRYDNMDRFEIIDDAARVNKDAIPAPGSVAKMGDVLDHPALYENYPQLKDVDVKVDPDLGPRDAIFRASEGDHGTIYLPEGGTDRAVILHELQHKVQDIEGFARGSSVAHHKQKLLSELDRLSRDAESNNVGKRVEAMDRLGEIERKGLDQEAFERYQREAGEIEAREVEKRLGFDDTQRMIYGHGDIEGVAPEDAYMTFKSGAKPLDAARESGNKQKKYEHFMKVVEKQFNKEWGDLTKGWLNEIKRNFSNTLSGEYMKKRDMVKAARAEAVQKAVRIQSALKQMPERDRKVLHEYIVGDRDDAPETIKKIAENVRATVRGIARNLVESGALSQETVDAWGKYYLKRLYEKHYTRDALDYIRGGWKKPAIHRRGKTEEITQEEFQRRVAEGEIDPRMVNYADANGNLEVTERVPLREGGIDVEYLPDGKIRLIRDWTKEEREAMGEITDAAITIPETILHMTQLENNAKFLKEVASVDGAVILPEEAKRMTKEALEEAGYYKAPIDPKYGVLAGQWVRQDVLDDINGINDRIFNTFRGNDGELARSWQKFLTAWKKSKTVWNLPTHFNNTIANPFIMNLAGMGPAEISMRMTQAGKMMVAGRRLEELEQKALIKAASRSELEELAQLRNQLRWYREAKAQGILNTSVMEDIGYDSVSGAKSALGKLDKKLTDLYQAEDGIGKLATYITLREAGFAKDDARRAVLSILPDYSDPMPAGWRKLRDYGITPFVAWSYYTYPKMLHLLATPRGAFNAATVLAGLEALSYSMTGEHLFMDESMPEDFRGKRLPIYRNGDKVTTYKIDKQIPYLQFFAPAQTAREFVYQGLPQSLISLASGVKLWNQRPITSEYKPKAQQAYDYFKYGVQSLTPIPGSVSSGWDFIEGLMRSNRNRRSSSDIIPRTTEQNVMKLGGLNILTYDKKKAEKKNKKYGEWW